MSARLDAVLLLAQAAGLSKAELIARGKDAAPAELETRYRELLERRRAHEPVAYIVGEKEFWGLSFKVNPAVLIPRPDTEPLVEEALRVINTRGERESVAVLDLGTGCGCIPIALAVETQKMGRPARYLAVDQSEAALNMARQNAVRHGVAAQIDFMCSDWFAGVPAGQRFDLIVSNPPYVSEGEREVSPETHFEPHAALYSGADGLAALRHILTQAHRYLTPGGVLLCEIGSMQQAGLASFYNRTLTQFYREIAFMPDLGGRTRVVKLAPAL